jgi:hypothetical protein
MRDLISQPAPRRRQRKPARGLLIGRDFARPDVRWRLSPRRTAYVVVGGVIAALVVAALRVDLIEQGYARANAMRNEKKLLEERRVLIAQLRGLRDPSRLSQWANKLELSRPKRIITLNSSVFEQRP